MQRQQFCNYQVWSQGLQGWLILKFQIKLRIHDRFWHEQTEWYIQLLANRGVMLNALEIYTM